MKVNTDPKKIDEVLSRFVENVVVKEELKKEMLSGKQLKIYLGTDVTGEDLHLGHAVIHRKLRDFQELGHKVTLVIGDYTTLVGDHSDKLDQRTETSEEKIGKLEKTYVDQFAKTVNIKEVDVVHNGDWLSKLTLREIIDLAKVFTVQQNIERDAFQKRLKAKSPIGLDEFLYPLMQGYDAYALKTDIQIGGTDQTFNLHAGRKIMEHFGVKPQAYITMDLLVGNDGRKMGKSLMNFIPITATPSDMYGQLMAINDDVMEDYFISLTRLPIEEIKRILKDDAPIDAKKKLAYEVTRFYSSDKEASEAQDHFENTVQKGQIPDEVKTYDMSKLLSKNMNIVDLLDEIGITPSRGEAKRLVKQGGVEVDEKKITDIDAEISIKSGVIVKAGKRNWIKLV